MHENPVDLSEEITSETVPESELGDGTPTERQTDNASPTDLPATPTVEELTAELHTLRCRLEESEETHRRALEQMKEFHELFPGASPARLPPSVAEDVAKGVPLAAAYALYEKREAARGKDAEAVNRENAARSAGPVGGDPEREFYTPEEVRGMTQKQVRRHYRAIVESMKRWQVGGR